LRSGWRTTSAAWCTSAFSGCRSRSITRRDPAIGAALAALGRNGVPVYVFFRPGKEPLLLPEVLQQRMILEALATL